MTTSCCYKCNVETVIGPGDPLLWPSYTAQLDFELELGFFISGGGVNLTPKQAADLIAGVTIFNDVSARDIQMFEMALTIGPSKGKDFCSAMGPCVLTMDEVDEWSVQMAARVNGETWATGTTGNRQFSFAEVLAWASLHTSTFGPKRDHAYAEFTRTPRVPQVRRCGYDIRDQPACHPSSCGRAAMGDPGP